MRIDGSLPPTNPYHIARAYGVQNAAGPASVGQTASVNQASGVGRVGEAAKQVLPSAAQRLVAAVVPGRVDFSGATAQASAGTLAFYRHPADKNAAATSVTLGKSLDVSG